MKHGTKHLHGSMAAGRGDYLNITLQPAFVFLQGLLRVVLHKTQAML
jgi:hypothetical protein